MHITSRLLTALCVTWVFCVMSAGSAQAQIIAVVTSSGDINYIIGGADNAVAADVGGITEISITPTFTVPDGSTLFGNVVLSSAISSFSTDGVSYLNLIPASPLLNFPDLTPLAEITSDLNLVSMSSASGAFMFTEAGPYGSSSGIVQNIDEPSSGLLMLIGFLGLLVLRRRTSHNL
jgi:hypothetical protein